MPLDYMKNAWQINKKIFLSFFYFCFFLFQTSSAIATVSSPEYQVRLSVLESQVKKLFYTQPSFYKFETPCKDLCHLSFTETELQKFIQDLPSFISWAKNQNASGEEKISLFAQKQHQSPARFTYLVKTVIPGFSAIQIQYTKQDFYQQLKTMEKEISLSSFSQTQKNQFQTQKEKIEKRLDILLPQIALHKKEEALIKKYFKDLEKALFSTS